VVHKAEDVSERLRRLVNRKVAMYCVVGEVTILTEQQYLRDVAAGFSGVARSNAAYANVQ
jgi:hypothetical protein